MAPIGPASLSLSALRYAVALSDERHFGRAARACHVTQPTLSAAIKQLERRLGGALFERSPGAVVPTALGERVVAHARELLDGVERLVEAARGARTPLSGPFRLGMIPTLGPYLLPHVALPLAQAFPRLELVFRELKTDDLLDELRRHQLDAGVLALPVSAHGITTTPLFDEPFLLLLPATHPLARKHSVRESDLSGERVLLLDEGHCLRDQALSICERAQARADPAGADFRATSIETLRHMVAAGMGLTLLPALAQGAAGQGPAGAVARPFAPPAPARRMALAWRKSHPRAADVLELARCLREHLPAAVKPRR